MSSSPSYRAAGAAAAAARKPDGAFLLSLLRPSAATHAALALAAAALTAALLGGGLALVGGTYMATEASLDDTSINRIPPAATLGVQLVLAGAALAPLLAGALLVTTAQRAVVTGRLAAAAIAAAVSAAAIAIIAACWSQLVVPGQTFNTSAQPDTLRQFLGGLIVAAYTPLALCAAAVAASLACASSAPPRARRPSPFQPDGLPANAPRLAALLAVCVAVAFATSIFTPVWNFSATSYFRFSSPYSILDPNLAWRFGDGTAAPGWSPPVVYIKLYSDVVVFFGAIAVVAAAGVAGTYVPALRRELHRRVDVTLPRALRALDLFPAGATRGELLVAGAVAGLYAYWLYYWGFSYARISAESAAMADAHAGAANAARVLGHLTTLTMALLAFPVARGSVWEAVFGIPFDRAIKFHRALGSLCWLLVTLHMLVWQAKWLSEGLLLQNIATVSSLTIAPCENLALPCVVNVSAGADASRQYSAASFAGAYDAGIANVTCGCVYFDWGTGLPTLAPNFHADNFTVVLAETAWLLLTAALAVALWARRAHYEAFQYTHHAVLLFFAAGLLHAWSHWYYTAAALILYAFDKVTRTVLAARVVTAASLAAAAPGVTRLVLSADFLRGAPLAAGQYAWINVPAVAAAEWHPFTISSPPAAALGDAAAAAAYGGAVGARAMDGAGEGSASAALSPSVNAGAASAPLAAAAAGVVTFHIKDMGAGTWTGRLAELARGLGASGDAAASLAVSVDGPYGRAGHFYERDTVVLFAGGIGVTPMHAIATELHARATGGGAAGAWPSPRLRRVILVWAVRELELLDVFADSLAALAADDAAGRFSVLLFCSAAAPAAAASSAAAAPSVRAAAASAGGGLSRVRSAFLDGTPSPGGEDAKAALLEYEWDAPDDVDPGAVEAGWAAPAAAAAARKAVRSGRPNARAILAAAVEEARAAHVAREGAGGARFDAHAAVTAMVCGPPGLSEAVSAAAFELQTDFHSETFHF